MLRRRTSTWLHVLAASATAALLLAACGGDDDSNATGSIVAQPSAGPDQQLSHEIGAAFAVDGTVIDHHPPGADLTTLTGAASPLLSVAAPRLGAVSPTDDPAQVLGAGRVIDNPYQPGNRDANSPFPLIKIAGLGDRPFPTGKWYKGFFYRTPARLDSNFADAPAGDPAAGNNGQNDTAQESVFAFPNRLNLDDRVPMVSAAFPRPRFIAPGIDPNADVYKLLNRFVIDDVFYPVIVSPLADLQLAASTGVDATLTRTIVHQDELTVATRWQSADASRQMELRAAVGSPYVTVRYQGIAPVLGIGQGIRPRLAKDPVTNLPLAGPITDYATWESVSGLVAVAASNGDLSAAPNQPFVEATALVNGVKTPDLTGSAFRFIYRVPDPARPASPRTNNNQPPIENLINRVMNVYASAPITLRWDAPSRTYVATQPFTGVIRAAFVNEAVIPDISTDNPAALQLPGDRSGPLPLQGRVPDRRRGDRAVRRRRDRDGALPVDDGEHERRDAEREQPADDRIRRDADPVAAGCDKGRDARPLQQLRPDERRGRRPVDAAAERAGDPAGRHARPGVAALVRHRHDQGRRQGAHRGDAADRSDRHAELHHALQLRVVRLRQVHREPGPARA